VSQTSPPAPLRDPRSGARHPARSADWQHGLASAVRQTSAAAVGGITGSIVNTVSP